MSSVVSHKSELDKFGGSVARVRPLPTAQKKSSLVRTPSVVKQSASSSSLSLAADDDDRSHLHADTLYKDLRGDVLFSYSIPIKAPFEIGRLEYMQDVEAMAEKLRSKKMYHLVEYENYSQVKEMYDNLELTGAGDYGRVRAFLVCVVCDVVDVSRAYPPSASLAER
jgi:hypothetical protein